jgi:hypothetical protein
MSGRDVLEWAVHVIVKELKKAWPVGVDVQSTGWLRKKVAQQSATRSVSGVCVDNLVGEQRPDNLVLGVYVVVKSLEIPSDVQMGWKQISGRDL